MSAIIYIVAYEDHSDGLATNEFDLYQRMDQADFAYQQVLDSEDYKCPKMGILIKTETGLTTLPIDKIMEAQELLNDWLIENTEKVFEEQAEIDQARGLLNDFLDIDVPDLIDKRPKPETYSETSVMTAMCLWEAAQAQRDKRQALRKFFADNGACEVRNRLVSNTILQACDRGNDIAREAGYDKPYDWEFVPWFFKKCITVDEHGFRLHPDWELYCAELSDQDKGGEV